MLENSAKKHFITFGDTRLRKTTERIRQQAEAMNFFDEIHIVDELYLESDFTSSLSHLLNSRVRGFGYWLWKPHIIRRQLERLHDNDILVYCDSGCHLNPEGVPRLKEYIEELSYTPLGIKAFPANSTITDTIEKRWTKGDIFSHFGCRNKKIVTETAQIAATQIFIRKCQPSMNFIREWEKIACENISLIDDSPSKTVNSVLFIENRHDQSIFSVLFKLRGGIPFPSGETDLPKGTNCDKYPIWNIRDKGVKDNRLIKKIQRFVKSRLFLLKIKTQPIKLKLISFFLRKKNPF